MSRHGPQEDAHSISEDIQPLQGQTQIYVEAWTKESFLDFFWLVIFCGYSTSLCCRWAQRVPSTTSTSVCPRRSWIRISGRWWVNSSHFHPRSYLICCQFQESFFWLYQVPLITQLAEETSRLRGNMTLKIIHNWSQKHWPLHFLCCPSSNA